MKKCSLHKPKNITFLEASRCLPKLKEDVCGWEDLRDKIKKDIEEAHKQNELPKHINQLLILWNFAMPNSKGMDTSL